jgi:hypothetical protein
MDTFKSAKIVRSLLQKLMPEHPRHTRSPHVWSVLGQIDSSEPFHDAVIRPNSNLTGRRMSRIFGNRTPLQTTRVVIVQAQDLDSTPDADEVKQVRHF